MEELAHLGARLRAARQARGWTLDALAQRAAVSASTLSRLESGKRQASLELLLPLTRELGIRVDDLLDTQQQDPRVRRPQLFRDGMIIAPLTREASDVQPYKITYHPDAPERSLQVHEGREWFYVLSGRVRLDLGDDTLELGQGEAAEFETTTPHRIRAIGAGPAEVISLFNTVGERMHLQGAAARGSGTRESDRALRRHRDHQ